MRRFNPSLRVRSSLFLILLLSGSIALLSVLTLQAVKTYQMDQMETDLANRAKTVNIALAQALLTAQKPESPEEVLLRISTDLLRQVTNERALSTTIYTLKGNAHNGSQTLEKQLLETVVSGKILYQIHDQDASQNAVYVDYLAPLFNENEIVGIIRLKYYYSMYIMFYQNIQHMMLITGACVFSFSLFAALMYYGRLTSAILKLKTSVNLVERGDYTHVEILNRNDELGELSKGIEQMASTIERTLQELQREQAHLMLAIGKLKSAESSQRTFFGNITHEFKTPLSVINAYNDLTELYGDDITLQHTTRHQIRTEVHKLTAMVEKALALAKMEKYDFELNFDTVDLKILIEDTFSRLKIKSDKYNLTWHLSLEPVTFQGDYEIMGQILVNVFDNAIKYNVSGGQIWIELKKTSKITLIIENTGEGISEYVKERLFEPFIVDDSIGQTQESGTGLGLSLVKKMIGLQRGQIVINEALPEHQSVGLKGCRVVIELLSSGDNSETTPL